MASKTNISLKLLVDKASRKVLFAEAGKDFVDFLFGLLEIPLGSLLGILVEQGLSGSGSLGRVYGSVQNLDPTYLQPNQDKDSLLRPKTSSSSSYNSHTPPMLQSLVSNNKQEGDPVSAIRYVMNGRSIRVTSYGHNSLFAPVEVGYVKGMVTYMVMDDLTVKPMSTISSITLLNTFAVKDVGNLLEKTVVLDAKKALELLKASFESNTVLTDVFIGKKKKVAEEVVVVASS